MARPSLAHMPRPAATVVAAYPTTCQPERIEPLGTAGGFSGARFWRIETHRGRQFCLRRWPREHPSPVQLAWIHAVLRHVEREGFRHLPVPLETRAEATYVVLDDALWQLERWLPGAANRDGMPPPERLRAALTALAQFHRAAASFTLPRAGDQASPGINARRQRLAMLRRGGIERLRAAIRPAPWPELHGRAKQLIDCFCRGVDAVGQRLDAAAGLRVPLQPCIRDVWSEHVLFTGVAVTGIVDFGAMRPENVAADVSRLLGSMAGGDQRGWEMGLAAYQAVRPLSPAEATLVEAFDHSGLLMAGIQWLEWIYVDDRQFEDRAVILARIDRLLRRLALCQSRRR